MSGSTSGLTATSDFFQVSGGALLGQDTDGEICYLSSPINIAGFNNVTLSALIEEIGDHEASNDYVDVTYIIDGASTTITNWMGAGNATHTLIGDVLIGGTPNDADWGSTTVTQAGLSGTTLQIQICINNGAGSENILIDDIVVTGELAAGPMFKYYSNNPDITPSPTLVSGPTTGTYTPPGLASGSVTDFWVTVCEGTCESMATQVTVTVNSLPEINSIPTDVTGCPGDATGAIALSVSGAPTLTYAWSTTNGSGLVPTDQNQTGLTAGTYMVTVTDGNSCTAVTSIDLMDAVDAVAPMIVCPTTPVDVNCGDSTLPSATGLATATDACTASPTISYMDVLVLDGCGGRTGTLTRTWQASDAACNIITCEQIINIIDNTAPTFTAPGPISITCAQDPTDLTITVM